MSISSNKCLTCRNWERTDDKLVGLCRKLQQYRFQLEGDDCVLFAFGDAREVMEPVEIPAPKRAYDTWTTERIRDNQNRIRRWHAEGRSFYWMAEMIAVPEQSYQMIPRWLKREGAL